MTKNDFIRYVEILSESKKTKVVFVSSSYNGISLGEIKWYAPWRRYCFYPLGDCIFDYKCLLSILNKISDLMKEREITNGK